MSESCTLQKTMVLNNGQAGSILSGKLTDIRKCGCTRTSDKIKKILGSFPAPIPPTTTMSEYMQLTDKACGFNYGQRNGTKTGMPPVMAECCRQSRAALLRQPLALPTKRLSNTPQSRQLQLSPPPSKSWQMVTELVALIQLSVTATALALYYLIYCYMHLVYFTLSSAMYFHNADGPMKITIGVVTVTTIIIGLHIMSRLQKVLGIFF